MSGFVLGCLSNNLLLHEGDFDYFPIRGFCIDTEHSFCC